MGKLKYLLVFLSLAWSAARAETETEWHLLVEPSFMHNDSSWPIVGSETAVLVPARYEKGEVLPLQRDEILKLAVSRKQIIESAPKAAARVLATLKPDYVRDANKVILYAILKSDSPLTASAVLAPKFTEMFSETLGPDILFCIPNRYTILVFPRESSDTLNLSDILFAEYQSSPYPVSREIFSLRDGKLIAIGRYR